MILTPPGAGRRAPADRRDLRADQHIMPPHNAGTVLPTTRIQACAAFGRTARAARAIIRHYTAVLTRFATRSGKPPCLPYRHVTLCRRFGLRPSQNSMPPDRMCLPCRHTTIYRRFGPQIIQNSPPIRVHFPGRHAMIYRHIAPLHKDNTPPDHAPPAPSRDIQ